MSIVVPNFAQIGGFLYFGGHFGFKMAAIANRNGRNMVQHVFLPVNIHFREVVPLRVDIFQKGGFKICLDSFIKLHETL
jgi:hypothetical protein